MSIPSDPTVASIVTEGLKRGGRVSPSAGQISDATEHQFREVKSDITQRSARHSVLEDTAVTKAIEGQSRYPWPAEADDIRSLTIITSDTNGAWQGTAQAGSAAGIILASTFDQDAVNVLGKYIFIFTSTAQVRQIVIYNNATKGASMDQPWVTQPSGSTLYHIGLHHQKIYTFDKPWSYDVLNAPYQRGTARHAAPVGRTMWLDYAPDRIYALWWDYWANLDRLDEAGTVFIRHLRDYRSLWLQGIAVKTMQRYDEDRYTTELQVYNNMLDAYAGCSAGVGQVNFTDI